MNWLKNLRNKRWAKKLKWTPEMFGETEFNRSLEFAIIYFQKQWSEFLDVDGVAGPQTYRFLLNDLDRDGKLDDTDLPPQTLEDNSNGQCLLIGGKWVDIGMPTVWMPLPSRNFKNTKKLRPITVVVVHHDATTSAKICFRALKNQKISSHLCIDNDGVIYQFVDLMDIAWHAGVSYWRKNGSRKRVSSRKLNNVSIGVDFSCGWYLKHNKTYIKKGFGPRPIQMDSRIHGMKMKPHLGMYPAQIAAFKVIARVLNEQLDIPLLAPTKNGKFNRGWVKECMKGLFKGFQVHFNSSINKIDTDIPLKEILDEVKKDKI